MVDRTDADRGHLAAGPVLPQPPVEVGRRRLEPLVAHGLVVRLAVELGRQGHDPRVAS